MDMVFTFLKNKKETDRVSHPELDRWIDFFTVCNDPGMVLCSGQAAMQTAVP